MIDRLVMLYIDEKAGVLAELVVEFQRRGCADTPDAEVPIVEGTRKSRPRGSLGQDPDVLRHSIHELVVRPIGGIETDPVFACKNLRITDGVVSRRACLARVESPPSGPKGTADATFR